MKKNKAFNTILDKIKVERIKMTCLAVLTFFLLLEVTVGYKAFSSGKVFNGGMIVLFMLYGYSLPMSNDSNKPREHKIIFYCIVISFLNNLLVTFRIFLPNWTILLVLMLFIVLNLTHNRKIRLSAVAVALTFNFLILFIVYPFNDFGMYHLYNNQNGNDSINISRSVISINGIEKFEQLKSLAIHSEHITTYEPITEISALESILIRNCDLSKLKEINPVKKVESAVISVREGSVFDIDTVFPNLKYLLLTDISSEDLTYLDGLKDLERLDLASLEMNNLRGIESLENLREVKLESVRVKNLSALEDLQHLEKIIFYNCVIDELELMRIIENIDLLVEIR